MEPEYRLRKEMAEIGRRAWQKNLVAASDGNLSVRLGPDRFLITPSGSCLGFLKPAELAVIDTTGRSRSPHRPTSEYRLHLEVYRLRPDVGAVIHAHPPLCTAFSVAGVRLDQCVVPEVVFTLGAIPTTPYATPTTEEPPRVIQEYINQCDALILDRHGSLTVGANLCDAFFKLEKIEHAASVILAARLLGKVQTLSREQVEKLMAVRENLGLRGRFIRCVHCAAKANLAVDAADGNLAAAISSEVLKIING
jgi:L-fuculose-phosphate aldolase